MSGEIWILLTRASCIPQCKFAQLMCMIQRVISPPRTHYTLFPTTGNYSVTLTQYIAM
jgi:hypothetical protein